MDSPRQKNGVPSQRYLQRRRGSLPAVLNTPDIKVNVDSDGNCPGKKPAAEEEMVMQLSKDIKDVLKRYRTTGSTGTASLTNRPWFVNAKNKEGCDKPRPSSSRSARRGSADMLTLTARFKAMKEKDKAAAKPPVNNHLRIDTDEGRARANSWSPVPGSPRAVRIKSPRQGENSPEDDDSPCASPPPSYLLERRRHSMPVDVGRLGTPRGILKSVRSARIPPTIWDSTFDEASGMTAGSKPGMYGNINFNGDVPEDLPGPSDAFRQALGCLARHNQHKADDYYRELDHSDSDNEAVYSKIQGSVPEKKGEKSDDDDDEGQDDDGDNSPTSHKRHVHFNVN